MRYFLSFLLAVAAVDESARAGTYTITDLGTLGGESRASCLSENGLVAGYYEVTPGSANYSSFLYNPSKATPMQDIGTLGGSSYARGVNDAGKVVGLCDNVGGKKRAFLYDPAAAQSLKDLGDVKGDGVACDAYAINASGQVTGWSEVKDVSYAHVFLYTPTAMTPVQDIGGVLTGHTRAYGLAMNDKGTVVGYSAQTDNEPTLKVPVRITQAGTQELPNTLGGMGGQARGINNHDHIVGYAYTTSTDYHAFLYRDGAMKDLGTLGGKSSQASDINDSGVIVGYSNTSSAAEHAFLYVGNTMKDLNDMIPAGSGWELKRANAINNIGQIVGQGTNPAGEVRAFLLTPVKSIAAAPKVFISGRKKFVTRKSTAKLRGTATGAVQSVFVKVGKKTKTASGTAKWTVKVKLKRGRNIVVAQAKGSGGASAPARVTIIRK